MPIRSAFKSIEGDTYRQFGADPATGDFRCGGRWVAAEELDDQEVVRLSSLSRLLGALPGWPLAEGLDLSAFRPDPHQFLVADLLATNWLEYAGVTAERRTRALVADEGGTGKTLAAALAVRWVLSQPGRRAPTIVLVPPLLVRHWAQHLKAVFHDDPDRVRVLRSARYYDPRQHAEEVVVVSKFSWTHHWKKISHHLQSQPPRCVVVDEVHQGRTGLTDEEASDPDETSRDEQGLGILLLAEEQYESRRHAQILKHTCRHAEYAVGVTATPINMDTREIGRLLGLLNAQHVMGSTSQALETWLDTLAALAREARAAQDAEDRCGADALSAVADQLEAGDGPPQWGGLDEDSLRNLSAWLRNCATEGGVTPRMALRLTRDLHPYGRHLCMTLRKDLDPDVADRFRTRREKALRVSQGPLEHFLTHIQRDGKSVGKGEAIGGSTALVLSHHRNPTTYDPTTQKERYPGPWSMGDGTALRGQHIVDPRFTALLETVGEDLKVEAEDASAPGRRGCVIFTEYKGTVDNLAKDLREAAAVEGIEVVVGTLTGDDELWTARQTLDRCERVAASRRQYPILICTSAGEVGLDMAWATVLVHWDLNPNPQRLEQRTWRLDRRLADGSPYRRWYLVVHMLLDGHPSMTRLENLLTDRYRQACRSLGLPERPYVPLPGEEVEQDPGGSNHRCQLLDDELAQLDRLLREEVLDEQMWPGPRLRQAERLRTAALLTLVGIENEPEHLLQHGRTSPQPSWADDMHIGNPRVGRVRDLESIAAPIARQLAAHMPHRGAQAGFACSWEVEGIGLPSARRGIQRLFPVSPARNEPRRVPVVRLEQEIGDGRLLLAVNEDLVALGRWMATEDHGMRLLMEDGKDAGDPAEPQGWVIAGGAIEQLVSQASVLRYETVAGWEGRVDVAGRELVVGLIKRLKRRNQNDQQLLEGLRRKLEDSEDDDRDGSEDAIEAVQKRLVERKETIGEMSGLQHHLVPLLLIEGGHRD